MTFKLGLTGSIGMGKSTTAQMFADEGCEIWDADAAVHRLYAKGGAAVAPLQSLFPSAIIDGAVSRDELKKLIAEDPAALPRIERIVHPLVARDREKALKNTMADIIVFDIPLLFENGSDAMMDATVCVSVSPEIQKSRVMARGTMTEDAFHAILSKQMPDEEKRKCADFVITTDTLEHARSQVQDVMKAVQDRIHHARDRS